MKGSTVSKKQRRSAHDPAKRGDEYPTSSIEPPLAQSGKQPSPAALASSVATAAGSLLAIATILGFFLHFAGDVSQSTYLAQLGLQPTSFPQPVEEKVIHGLYVVVSEGIDLFSDVQWLKVLSFLALATGFFVVAGAPVKSDARLLDWLKRQSYWVRQPIVASAGIAGLGAAAISVAALISIASTTPGIAGQRFGKAKAATTVERLTRGELASVSELWRGESFLAQGEIIITSNDLIAIYDIDQRQVRTLRADGIEVRAPLGPPKSFE